MAKSWPELPGPRQRACITALLARIDVRANQIDIHLRPTRIDAILDIAATPVPPATDEANQIVSLPVRLRRSGRETTMRIDGTDPFATRKPDVRLVKLLIRAHRFHAAVLNSNGAPYGALAKREGVSPSYFTRLVRLSYLAPDIAQAILDGRQPRGLTPDRLLAHSRLPLAWHDQRTALGFA
jgi:site-specific DNA recombinase